MLLSFKTSNFKSFLNEIELKMTPAPKIKGIPYSIFESKIGNKKYKALSTSVIYGPNAAGKTNIVSAMDVFKNIILRGNIKNSTQTYSPDYAAWNLELVPNFKNLKIEPTTFSITFISNNILFDYSLSIDIGDFLNENYDRTILEEILSIDNEWIYKRSKDNLDVNIQAMVKYISSSNFSQEAALELAMNNLDSKELFLCNGFKNVYSKKLYDILFQWFNEYLGTIYRADSLEINFVKTVMDADNKVGKIYNKLAKEIGISTNGIDFMQNKDESSIMVSLIADKNSPKMVKVIPSEVVESFGTIRFLNLFPIFNDALERGGTLVIDELDSSINPMIIMSLINVFHNDEINTKGAQLIFNTHNPIFLNKNLLRRDEIKFVEKDDVTNISEVYALSDFGTSGKSGVRNTSDYMKNYYINKYGAIKYIDLSDIFKESGK
ncbi:MAG: ATP-binding protein [Clostridia bacterium]|nr:ATP-binding protein [Clostridia bacterium]